MSTFKITAADGREVRTTDSYRFYIVSTGDPNRLHVLSRSNDRLRAHRTHEQHPGSLLYDRITAAFISPVTA